MQDHLTADALERLVERRCHVSLAYGWLLHLLGCETCRNRLVSNYSGEGERFLREIFRTQQPVSMPELKDPETVDRILAHLKTDGISSFLETRPLPDYLQTLPHQPEVRQAWAVRNSQRLRDPAIVEHLLSQCPALWHQDPELAGRLAKLAVLIVDHLPSEEVHPEILQELRFEAWGKLGNSLRVLGKYRAALVSFEKACRTWNGSARNPILQAQHLRYEGLLQRALGHPDLAMDLARRAESLQTDVEPIEALATVTLISNSLARLGRHGEERQRLETCLETVSIDDVGPEAYAALLHNLAGSLARQRLILPAWSLLEKRDRLAYGAAKLFRFRMMWMNGRFYEKCGDLPAAEEIYRHALQVAEELSLEGDQALALVDLTRVSVLRGLPHNARDFSGAAARRLRQLGLDHFADKAVAMVCDGPLVTLS